MDAVNAQDWDAACALSVAGDDCPRMLQHGFGDAAGRMRIEGFYSSGQRTSFAVNAPKGFKPVVERVDGDWRVHFEVAVIR